MANFNASEQFQNGPTRRAEKAEAEFAARVQALAHQLEDEAAQVDKADPDDRFTVLRAKRLTLRKCAKEVAALAAAGS